MSATPPADESATLARAGETGDHRWRFLRDVLVFQLKMLLGNLRDFALIPVSLTTALIDLISKGEREGSLFYRVMRWGWHSEEVLDVYSPIKHETAEFKINPHYTVDGVVARLEGVVVREYEKGGTAASIKAALDRAINQLHDEASGKRDQARDVVARTRERLRSRRERLEEKESRK